MTDQEIIMKALKSSEVILEEIEKAACSCNLHSICPICCLKINIREKLREVK